MNFTAIRNVVTSGVTRQLLQVQKHSPTLLFASGLVGVVGTVVLASKATLHLEETLEATQENMNTARELHETRHLEYSDKDYKQDVAVLYVRSALSVVRLYAPALGLGVVSVVCLTSSHNILNNRNAGLMAAYATLDKAFKEYEKRVIDHVGEDQNRELRYGTVDSTETKIGKDGQSKTVTVKHLDPNGISQYARFFDESCSSWQANNEYNKAFLRCQQNYANDRLLARGHLFLNEVYDSLGLPHTKAGAVVGWVVNDGGDNYVDFGMYNGDRAARRDFVNGNENSVLLDFNVDGVIYDKI